MLGLGLTDEAAAGGTSKPTGGPATGGLVSPHPSVLQVPVEAQGTSSGWQKGLGRAEHCCL